MEEPQGAQYAVQIAVHTLRERCKNLQQRVLLLEEENINLRIQCSRREEDTHSLSELDFLREQVAQLSQQKEQLQNKIKMVTGENQELWNKLSKLTRVNKSLGSQLTKINDTLTQHSTVQMNPVQQSTLLRSKTFTKNELQTKVLQKNLEENDKISLELEDISLKFSDSFSKQKKELDLLCSEISDMQLEGADIITEYCGFYCDDELLLNDDDIVEEFKCFGDDLKLLKDVVLQQQTILVENLRNMDNLKDKLQCKTCSSKKQLIEKGTSTVDLPKTKLEDKSIETEVEHKTQRTSAQISPSKNKYSEYPGNLEKICPLCAKIFLKDVDFNIFQQHVEEHFELVPDIDSFEML